MKRLVLFSLILMFSVSIFGQKVGVKVGANLMNYKNDYGYDSKVKFGYHASAFFQKSIIPTLSIRPELGLYQNGYNFESTVGVSTLKGSTTTNNLTFLMNLRFKPLIPVYGFAGPYFGYLMSGEHYETLYLNNNQIWNNGGEIDFKNSDINRLDYGLSMGFGYQINLTVLKAFFEAQYLYGLSDLDKRDNYVLYSRTFTLSLGVMIGL